MTDRVAIVGAGAAGAAAAYALRDAAAEVTVFEKSRDTCGRAATRRQHGCTYDYGANYVKSTDDAVADLVESTLEEGLVDVTDPVWTFDADGEISAGREADEHKWTYTDGIAELADRLFARTDAAVTLNTRVATPIRDAGRWELADDAGDRLGRFDAVLLTPPAPQTADLLGAANWELALCRELREAIAVVPYRTILSVVLHYPFELDLPYYALVNTDKEHDVGWLSREECKPGHVPEGESLLVVQPSPDWSVDHYTDTPVELSEQVASMAADLLGNDRLADPDWTDHKHWRYALPDRAPETDVLSAAADYGLYFAGDWVAGEGRVHAAVSSGLAAGERIGRDL
ncbi:NAD/FAD-dependent oxidoreductase [Halobacteriales archaeon QS_1_68_17]|nr:MAG: NAD/FAD-dependent oxidoreductase [Halobacteriales archaeon QS_1_68_17]